MPERTGRRQKVAVDARHAAASLRSYVFAHPVGEPPPSQQARQRARITRIAAARDGRYVQLHGSFHDRPAILQELGLDETASPDQIDAAVAQTCMWYQRLGDDNELDAAYPGDIEPFVAEMDTPDFGRISTSRLRCISRRRRPGGTCRRRAREHTQRSGSRADGQHHRNRVRCLTGYMVPAP